MDILDFKYNNSIQMGACMTDSRKKTGTKHPQKWNPIKKLLQQYSIESLKNQWGSEEFELMINRLKNNHPNGYTWRQFIELFPNLNQYSSSTKRRVFKLCNTEGKKRIQVEQIVVALTIIHKSDDEELIGRLIFYIYSDQPQPQAMTIANLQNFIRENQKLLQEQSTKKKPCLQDIVGERELVTLDQFQRFLQFYDIGLFIQLFQENVSDIEKEIADAIREKKIITRAKGERVYVFEYQWFLQWKKYMAEKYQIEITLNNEKNIDKKVLKDPSKMQKNSKIKRPGIVKNSILLADNSVELKYDLVEFRDFIFLPRWLSESILSIYKASPPIKKTYPQLHQMYLVHVEMNKSTGFFEKNYKKFKVSEKQMSFRDYFAEQKIPIPQNTYCMIKTLWKYNWEEITDLSILLKEKADYKFLYFCFVPFKLKQLFIETNNVQEVNGKKRLKNRIKNFGTPINFPYKGVIKEGCVFQFNDEINLLYRENEGKFSKLILPVEDIKDYNLQELDKKVDKNFLAGFRNFSNNCYINSVMQCIIRTPLFGEYLQKQCNQSKNMKTFVLSTIHEIYIKSKQINIIETKQLKSKIEKHFPSFEGDEHQDAQELLNSLLTCLLEEIKELEQFKVDKSKRMVEDLEGTKNKRINQFFSGVTEITTQCLKCRRKKEKFEPFFTYQLSLPQYKQDEFFFTYVSKEQQKFACMLYGLTLWKKTNNYEFMNHASQLLKKSPNRLYFVYVSNGEIMGRLDEQLERQTLEYRNFNMNIVCYESKNVKSSGSIKDVSSSLKIEVQFRVQNEQKHKYTLLLPKPFIIEISEIMKWEEIKVLVQQIINDYLTEAAKGLSGIKNKSLYQIRMISRNLQNYCCFLCNLPFQSFKSKSWFLKDVCSYEEYKDDMMLFKSKRFIKNSKHLAIVVDFKDSSLVDFKRKPIEHESYEQAKKHNENRKDFLDQIMKNNFQKIQQIQLKCEWEDCQCKKANRYEKIFIYPNILLLHFSRFRYQDGTMVKMQNNIIYDQKFIIDGIKYYLYAVVAHKGHCNGGHYIAYVKCDNLWFKCDDEVVSPEKNKKFINSDAYILFYKRDDFEPSLQSLQL